MHDCQQETRLALIEKALGDIGSQMKDVHSAIMGNGRPGIRTEMAVVQAEMDDLREARKTSRTNAYAMWVALASVVLAQILVKIL